MAYGPFPTTYMQGEGWQASLFPLWSGRAALLGCEAALGGGNGISTPVLHNSASRSSPQVVPQLAKLRALLNWG